MGFNSSKTTADMQMERIQIITWRTREAK